MCGAELYVLLFRNGTLIALLELDFDDIPVYIELALLLLNKQAY